MKKSLKIIFWVLVVMFFVVLGEFFIPPFRNLLKGPALFLTPLAVFSLSGLVLLILALKERVEGRLKKLRKFLILTGVSAFGFFVFVLLHNLFYALGVISSQIPVLSYLMEILHIAFFVMAIFVCPIGFLIGLIGSIVLFIKNY